jgi:hypothetical protein
MTDDRVHQLVTDLRSVAARLLHVHSRQGFFNLSAWLTAIVGAAILLLAFHSTARRSRGRHSKGESS